jgi:hypothetical protein
MRRPLWATSVNVQFCSVGRPGLDPGTLGLKEGCTRSDWSGGVGIIRESKKICPVVSDSSGGVGLVCGMKCGIFERTVQLRIALADVRSRNETLERLATSNAFANLEREPQSLLSEVPDSIQVQVLYGPRTVSRSTTFLHVWNSLARPITRTDSYPLSRCRFIKLDDKCPQGQSLVSVSVTAISFAPAFPVARET